MAFTFVSTMDEVIHLMLPAISALVLADSPPKRGPRRKQPTAADHPVDDVTISAEQVKP
jgi:hypothetical protein